MSGNSEIPSELAGILKAELDYDWSFDDTNRVFADAAAHVVSRLSDAGYSIVPTPGTAAFKDATRVLIGSEAWVFGISETELRDVTNRIILAAAAAAAEEDTNG